MTTPEHAWDARPEGIDPESSLWPQNLVDLFIRPTRFFSSQLALGRTPFLLLATWSMGVASAIGWIDQRMLHGDLSTEGAANPFIEVVATSWGAFWAFAMFAGAFSAWLWWHVGGSWYAVRVRWSGDPAPGRAARIVYVYASFVYTAPMVMVAMASTLLFPDYAGAWAGESIWPAIVIVFPFWSSWVSYRGVRTVFSVDKQRSAVWFLILPVLIDFALLGGVAALYATRS